MIQKKEGFHLKFDENFLYVGEYDEEGYFYDLAVHHITEIPLFLFEEVLYEPDGNFKILNRIIITFGRFESVND